MPTFLSGMVQKKNDIRLKPQNRGVIYGSVTKVPVYILQSH